MSIPITSKVSSIVSLIAVSAASCCGASDWTYQWNLTSTPDAEITPLLYDKKWAYTVEIDDTPSLIASLAEGLLAGYEYTDAPPGVSGGNRHSFVGTAAVYVYVLGANSTYLNPETLQDTLDAGWGVANHSYFHRGRTWEPPEILTEEEIREDLYWSQTVLAHDFGGGRAPVHFVYPNGYMGYQDYLNEFGMLSASRVGGSAERHLYVPDMNYLDLSRAYLDDGYWVGSGGGGITYSLVNPDEVTPGYLQIDFTHGISPAGSDNHSRWVSRLDYIESNYGASGQDNLWSAPVGDVVSYVNAAQVATLLVDKNLLQVSLPDDAPGSRLTIRIDGISPTTNLPAPDGGLLYRSGSTVWITTPLIGEPGSAPPKPTPTIAYEGAVEKQTFDEAVWLAGVQLMHSGSSTAGQQFEVLLTLENGETQEIYSNALKGGWSNGSCLASLLPNGSPVKVTGVEVTPNSILKGMRVWTVPPEELQVVNKAPVIDAGDDVSILLDDDSYGNYVLKGSLYDDGLPLGHSLSIYWSIQSHPENALPELEQADEIDPHFTTNMPGAYVLQLAVSDGVLTSTDAVTLNFTYPANPYLTWRQARFTQEELLDLSISGNDADPDGNGRGNLLDFTFGGLASSQRSGQFMKGGPEVIFCFARDPSMIDINYDIETSTTLEPGSWDVVARSIQGEPCELVDAQSFVVSESGHDPVEVTIQFAGNESGPRFYRIALSTDHELLQNGVAFAYYEGVYSQMPNFDMLTPIKQGYLQNISLGERNSDDYFLFEFNALLQIEEPGDYTFYVNSDDGSRLYIDGQLIVDNGGLHSEREYSGSVNLGSGFHDFSLQYLEAGGYEVLTASYEGPGISKQPIPDTAFYLNGQ
ncbi:PA14 domain-containing protein [Cerasicoccus frondis]|uniref:PA14 domain-containing protein n=1 Tax=Cerasicoccus frondis TaxID=490090 RepID=UPI002852C3A4|nr:PA14 domain-containing protein [Cerasicoccus frondis]